MITPLYAAIFALLLVAMSLHIIKSRAAHNVGIGDGNNFDLRRRIRAQGNLTEYAPIFILLLAFAEYNGLPFWAIHIFGLTFLTARLSHAYSLLYAEKYTEEKLIENPVWRIGGMMMTMGTISLLAVINLIQVTL